MGPPSLQDLTSSQAEALSTLCWHPDPFLEFPSRQALEAKAEQRCQPPTPISDLRAIGLDMTAMVSLTTSSCPWRKYLWTRPGDLPRFHLKAKLLPQHPSCPAYKKPSPAPTSRPDTMLGTEGCKLFDGKDPVLD